MAIFGYDGITDGNASIVNAVGTIYSLGEYGIIQNITGAIGFNYIPDPPDSVGFRFAIYSSDEQLLGYTNEEIQDYTGVIQTATIDLVSPLNLSVGNYLLIVFSRLIGGSGSYGTRVKSNAFGYSARGYNGLTSEGIPQDNISGNFVTSYNNLATGVYATYTPYTPAPVSDFTATPLSGIYPLTVQFTDTSTNTPTSWLWSFGDGGASGEQNPSHQYTRPGVYTVSLTATNAAGSDTESKSGYITVLKKKVFIEAYKI